MAHLFDVLKFGMIPAGATLASGIIAAVRPVGARSRSYVQHLAAGVVFSAAAGEILPEIKRQHDPRDLIIGFILGVVAMLAIQRLAQRLGGDDGSQDETEGGEQRSPVSMLLTVAIDVFIDGVLIGIAFGAGEKAGVLLTIALTLELLFLGLAVSTTLQKAGASARRRMAVVAGLAGLLLMGAAMGNALQGILPVRGQTILLSFGLAALLFLVVEELLVEAHEIPETPASTASFFIGFLGLTVIEMLT